MRPILILIITLTVTACATTMNKDQCLIADWRTVGYEDGSLGRNEQWLAKRRDACAEFGVAPDLENYLGGRDEGLRVYCRPRRGFDLGLRNVSYNNICPSDVEAAFLNAYQDGKGLMERERRFNRISKAIADASIDLDAIDKEITATTIDLATQQLTTQEQVNLALNLKDLAEERGRIKGDLPAMEAEREEARIDLDAYQAYISPKYPGA